MPYTVVDKGSKYFNTVTWTGNGGTLNVTGVGFKPDLVWIKCRDIAYNHRLYDAVRGVLKSFNSNLIAIEESTTGGVSSYNVDGYTNIQNADSESNNNGINYCSWNWLGANTTVSNTAGTRTSTVSANTTSGFSIVSYTGNQVAGATVGHGLGVKPDLMIVKLRSGDVAEPMIYHKSLGATKAFKWNTADAPITNTTIWNDTEPTTTVFSVGTSNNVNHVYPLIAYCFAEVKGFSKFGSYTGNGSTDGTFVYTGFKPAFVMTKESSGTSHWIIHDTKRSPNNEMRKELYPNLSNAEAENARYIDCLSNGFKIRSDDDTQINGSGSTYIYMAFADSPFVSSKAIPTTAR
jgi:hypothetical protein